jgi:hypothetical protein
MSQLTKYVIALSHLYGMVHKDKVVEIYNSQNEDQIHQDNIEAIHNDPWVPGTNLAVTAVT